MLIKKTKKVNAISTVAKSIFTLSNMIQDFFDDLTSKLPSPKKLTLEDIANIFSYKTNKLIKEYASAGNKFEVGRLTINLVNNIAFKTRLALCFTDSEGKYLDFSSESKNLMPLTWLNLDSIRELKLKQEIIFKIDYSDLEGEQNDSKI